MYDEHVAGSSLVMLKLRLSDDACDGVGVAVPPRRCLPYFRLTDRKNG